MERRRTMLEEAIKEIDTLRREVRAKTSTVATVQAAAVLAECVMKLNALKMERDTRK